MKRKTALRYAEEIANRIHSVNGLLATPLCDREAARISRVWVFGSTAKGSAEPNDLDILIDISEVGRIRNWRQARLDRWYRRTYGMFTAPSSVEYALKWLTKGMKKVSRHTTRSEGAKLDVKVLIYPRFDLEST